MRHHDAVRKCVRVDDHIPAVLNLNIFLLFSTHHFLPFSTLPYSFRSQLRHFPLVLCTMFLLWSTSPFFVHLNCTMFVQFSTSRSPAVSQLHHFLANLNFTIFLPFSTSPTSFRSQLHHFPAFLNFTLFCAVLNFMNPRCSPLRHVAPVLNFTILLPFSTSPFSFSTLPISFRS